MEGSTKKSKKNVLLLGIVSLINDFSSEMIMPILPLFLEALGGSGIIIGLVGGIRDSVASILNVFSGYFSDKTGKRKVFLISGYLSSTVFKLFLAFSTLWQHVLLFAGLERIGKGLRKAPRDAIIADSIEQNERGKWFGIHKFFDTLGAILGAVSVFLLFWFLELDYKTIILIAAIIAFFSLIPLILVKEKKTEPNKNITLKIGLKELPNKVKLFIIISGIYALANFSYMFFVLKAKGTFEVLFGEGKFAVGIPILLYILYNIFFAAFAIPFGKLSDRIGRRKVIISGFLLFSLTSLGFAFFNSLIWYLVLFALYGISSAIIESNQKAFISDISQDGFKATALGTYHTVVGIAALPASLMAGYLFQFNPNLTFLYGSLMSAFSILLFLIFNRKFK